MSDRPDRGLWVEVGSGDAEAFGVVFDRYADFVYNLAFRRTGSWDAAEDVVAAVFLEAWRQRDRIVLQEGSLRPWLVGVTLNLSRRYWRQDGRRRHAVQRLEAFEPTHVRDHAGEVADRIASEAQMREVMKRLDVLPPEQREVIELWAWEELTYEEIARALNIPPGTVRSRLHRARERLQGLDGTGRGDRESTHHRPTSGVVDWPGEEGARP